MIKISALNEESDEDSDSEEEVTREALEQIALQQYVKALELQRKGCLPDATQLLKDLLDTELLYDVKKPAEGEKVIGPLLNLKYLSYKNLASMLNIAGDTHAAIEAYCAATELDDTDVSLWYRLGQLCMQTNRYEMALLAYQRGIDCNPRHWPCIDKIVTIQLGLDYKEECLSTIFDALKLDPDYLRGLVYRRHIYTVYTHMKEYMEYINPIYKWDVNEQEEIDEVRAEELLKEADDIRDVFIEQQKAEQFKYVLPNLKLIKPITNLNWQSVGETLVHMHQYMTENCYSHACHLELIFKKELEVEPMDVCEEPKNIDTMESKMEDNNTDGDKNTDIFSENENNDLSDKEKPATDTEKVESDLEAVPAETVTDAPPEPKSKKAPVLRRGSALSSLEQWGWCTKRRSVRKKTNNVENIYDTLRRMIPIFLTSDNIEKKENKDRAPSPNTEGIEKLFEPTNHGEGEHENNVYFNTEEEQKDVEAFINKYKEPTHDIIDILKDYLMILSKKWNIIWPENLGKIFIRANNCYNNHIDTPACTDDCHNEIIEYVTINLLCEEFSVNEIFCSTSDNLIQHDVTTIEMISFMLNQKPHIFDSTQCLEFTLRYLWVKLHINILKKCDDFALDCLYQLVCEFEAMGEYRQDYCLNVQNFTVKPIINEAEVMVYIKFLERNKKLSTVMDLYEKENYEEVLSIVIDSFEHCKDMARKQEEEMSLDFAVQLALILDTYWALDQVDECFKWALICLHEALKHYFRYTSGSPEYEKWTLTVVKILCSIEHIMTTEGLSCLEIITEKELGQGLENLIRIIGHQVETSSTEMPFDTVAPWIIMYYILQREDDLGRGKVVEDTENVSCDDVPNPLMVLFIGHEKLGNRGWCCKNDGKLLYFILDTVVPRLRTPSLSKSLEQVCQYMQQCVYCLYGHPERKNKVKYLADHNIVTPYPFDSWERAQQVYEIFRPSDLPQLEGKVPAISEDTKILFHRILELVPSECLPIKYVAEFEKYIKGIEEKLPTVPVLLPYKIRDIYFLLGDYYFKKEDGKMAVKNNMLDIVINSDRLESWAEISLAKAVNLERLLNSCKNLNNEREYLNPAKSIIRCFKRALEIDPTHCNLWIEYGIFVYTVHSFCSRLLEQSSDSFSMEDFESLEKQKEEMLNTTEKCFTTVLQDLDTSNVSEKDNEDSWLPYYMLGKVAEKRKKPPAVYLDYYLKGVKSLQDSSATYPLKINCNSPTHLCLQVLELHYRIHASILKYIEQHEDKPIPNSIGKVFLSCIEEWKKGPFAKKPKGDGAETDNEAAVQVKTFQAANIFKRSISDAGEEDNREAKKLKLESAAAKVKRSASYDTEMIVNKDSKKQVTTESENEHNKSIEINLLENKHESSEIANATVSEPNIHKTVIVKNNSLEKIEENKQDKKEESSSCTSSTSSSASSSSDSTTDSSSDSSKDSDISNKSVNCNKTISQDDISKIVSDCLDALEDCASRFPPHYKAIYRLTHYHFYSAKGKDIERCRDLMLSTFTSRSGQKLGGLFNDRKSSNFFNNIWKITLSEVDRGGGFAYHMNRSVLLTLQILKEIDDHKTLLELSLHLQRIPDSDKKYVRDSDREELSQQAYTLCVKSLKGQLLKFSQQADLNSNDVERQALKSLMLDIYRAYQKGQKQMNCKQLSNLLVEGYKLVNTAPITDNVNLVDVSIKYCQSLIVTLKQQAVQATIDKSQNAQKKLSAKMNESAKSVSSLNNQVRTDKIVQPPVTVASSLPKMSSNDIAAAFQSYMPMLNDPMLSQQAAAALSLSYLSNLSAIAGYSSLQNNFQSTLQNSLQNSFQAEFYRQFLGQTMSSFYPPPKKQKRGPKPGSTRMSTPSSVSSANVKSKSFTTTAASVTKATPTPVITSLHKTNSAPLTPSMGTVLSTLPASMTASLSSFGGLPQSTHSLPAQAHTSTASTVTATVNTKPILPHQQVSPGKTLQEKLAERQKHMPKVTPQDINASIGRLPSSLTITKTNLSKSQVIQPKKPEVKKTIPFTDDDVIILDDD